MSFPFHPEAEEEFNDAIDYYEEIALGLDMTLHWRCIQRLGDQLNFQGHRSCSKGKPGDLW